MCSIEEDDLTDIRAKEEADRLRSSVVRADGRHTLCQKCRAQPAALLLRVNDIYCIACFLAAVTHKFRATLGKSRLLQPGAGGRGEFVLVAFSGRPASCVLARLLRDGVQQAGSRRLRCQPRLLHVDESALLAHPQPAAVLRLAVETGLPVYSVPLEYVMAADGVSIVTAVQPAPGETVDIAPSEHAEIRTDSSSEAQDGAADLHRYSDQLLQLWTAAGSGTSREQLLERLRGELLARAARQLDCRLLMLAETETRLAVRLLADLAGGRGAHAQQQTALADQRHDGLLVLRPLREICAKQVALFAHHSGVEYVAGNSLHTRASAGASIGRATEAFVLGLQADFPATVSTVYRTGTKLAAVGALPVDCALCRLPLDTGGGSASALHATRFSQLVSASGPTIFDYDRDAARSAPVAEPEQVTETSGGGDVTCSSRQCRGGDGRCGGSGKVRRAELLASLCYGCQLMVRDMAAVDSLPPYVWRQMEARFRAAHMRRQIQEFVIDDS